MLPQWSSQTPYVGGLKVHECPRCHREVELPFGAVCRDCVREINRIATRWARRAALSSTLLVGAYTWLNLPADQTARTVLAASVVMWYALTHMLVKRGVTLYLRQK